MFARIGACVAATTRAYIQQRDASNVNYPINISTCGYNFKSSLTLSVSKISLILKIRDKSFCNQTDRVKGQ